MVWDEIHGRDIRSNPVEEWGGIAYALAGLDVALPPDWQMVPLIKVGSDLAAEAAGFLGGLRRLVSGGRCIEVPVPNNRVVLHYRDEARRCERMSGGVPGWTWAELGPMVRDLDALYVNFISGFELELGTAEALRRGFAGPIYADFHSLLLGMGTDGVRVLRPLPEVVRWLACFDAVQMNEEELAQLADDPLDLAARAMAAGTRFLIVTAGARGAIWLAAPGVRRLEDRGDGGPVRTARVPAPIVESLDPTGCGDVFGAGTFARMLAGEPVEQAVAEGVRLASRNAGFRGASGLAAHLRGQLVEA